MSIIKKNIKDFNSYEKLAWDITKHKLPKRLQNIPSMIKYIEELSILKKVHFKDKWDLYVSIIIESVKNQNFINSVLPKKMVDLYKHRFIRYQQYYIHGRTYILN